MMLLPSHKIEIFTQPMRDLQRECCASNKGIGPDRFHLGDGLDDFYSFID